MRIFDPQIRSDTRNIDDLRNLAYFDTEEVVTTAHVPRQREDARDVLQYFASLLDDELPRLQRCGLRAHVALGVLPTAQPRRAHPELWSALPDLLADPRVVALGEVGAWEDTRAQWALFDRQVSFAVELAMPVIVTPPVELRINMTYKMMARLQKLGMAPSRCLMNLLDEPMLRTVVEEGFMGGVAVGYRHIEPREASAMLVGLLEELPAAANQTLLNSSLRRGAADVLGIPKTVVALADAGVPADVISRLSFDNAEAFFRSGR